MPRHTYLASLMDMLSVFLLVLHLKKTIKQEKPLISKIQNCLLYRKEDSSFLKRIGNCDSDIKMRTSNKEQMSGKCTPDMAQSIIEMCNRTCSRERRIGVLYRSLEPRLSVWDCVPESIIDTLLQDAVFWRPDSLAMNAYFRWPFAV